MLGPLGLEVQVVLFSYLVYMLETKLGSSGRVAGALSN